MPSSSTSTSPTAERSSFTSYSFSNRPPPRLHMRQPPADASASSSSRIYFTKPGPTFSGLRSSRVETLRKPRRIETLHERNARNESAEREPMDRALSEQDKLDAMVRRSIEAFGA